MSELQTGFAVAQSTALKGLAIPRIFTKVGADPFASVQYEKRSSIIRNTDGTVVFEMNDVEVPIFWSQVATDILAQKYFRKTGVPQTNEDGTPKRTADGQPALGSEHSVKQVVHRMVGCWRYWGEKYGYFATTEDAAAYYDESVYMMLHQMGVPNSPQFFNTGLNWAYGINSQSQGHYYVDPGTGVLTRAADAYTHPQPHACVVGDTKLLTSEGWLTISEVVQNNRTDLLVYDGNNWAKILAVKKNGKRQVFRMKLSNGQYVDLTADHLVMASKEREKEGGWYSWLPAEETLNKKVLFVTKQEVGAYSFLKEKEMVTTAQAELVGFHVGDGYAGTYNKTTLFGVVAATEDEFVRIARLFEDVFGAYTVTAKPNISPEYKIVKHDFKETIEFRQVFELGLGSRNVGVPKKIFAATPEAQRAFLRGLFQADGAVRIRKDDGRNSGDVCLATTSAKLAHEVHLLLSGLGIYSRISECRDRRENRGVLNHVIIAYASERKKFEEQVGFASKRKMTKLRELNETVDGKNKKNISEETVIAFEPLDVQEVFDIQTSTEKFAANGVVVHNCFIQSIKDDLVNEGGIMDLWVREARLFKYGSGTGTNFSSLRGNGEPLSGGGRSSGLMSFLKIGDRAAGAIKSGGTTRRAAKMVCLDIDHPDIEAFVNWKVEEEKKVAALIVGGYPSDYEGEAYLTVSGQNSNNSVRIPNSFFRAVLEDGDWNLKWRTDDRVCKTFKARDLWQKIAYAAWSCADPGIQTDTIINEWHTCPKSGRINASNPCSEYMFLDNTACNLMSLNLQHFFDANTLTFKVDDFRHAVRIWTITLEISVLMAQYPSKEIGQMSYDFRTLGLGYANLGSGVLMASGIAYDSPPARAIAGAVTAIMTGVSYATSAEMAGHLGMFPKYNENKEEMLRVMRNHRRAVYNTAPTEYEKLEVLPVGLDQNVCPSYLLKAAQESWDEAVVLGERYGYRNAQTTLLAPTGTIGLLMDCATTGVEPDFALVKFKKLAGGGYMKIVNESLPTALRTLGYNEMQIKEIVEYVKGRATLKNAPHINHESLKAKGFTEKDLEVVEKNLAGVFEIPFAFNVWTLGEEVMKRLGLTAAQYNDFNFNLLKALGFTDTEIEAANEFVCGAMTIEGAPYLKSEHYSVFDCANRCGKKGQRFIHHLGHIRMMAAVQPFLSGAISKTINMPNEVTVDDVKDAYMESWRLGLKAVALYRDGCKLSQPLSTKSDNKKNGDSSKGDTSKMENKEQITNNREQVMVAAAAPAAISNGAEYGVRRQLPAKRTGITVEAKIGNQQVYIRTGEYPNGALGEIFIDMFREGAAFRSLLNCFAVSISLGLQYGVPLEKFVEKFTFTRFEPSGFTNHPNVKMCTSVIDYIFRVLAMEYLGRTDIVQVAPTETRADSFQDVLKAAPFIKEASATMEIKTASVAASGKTAVDAQLEEMMGDAPACDTCGHITVRNGSCYKCLNCGNSMGCS
ncbi:MAG: ribonucleoside-diphosphate reductase, adenosylcobalamin-dependent [Candidatus Magasanikbacteria bacterium]|nr:ribonucleoside-diphosphate reductase, adenosylcobalamin-dependent [Candidatus Magasanikbacteria bacterium]